MRTHPPLTVILRPSLQICQIADTGRLRNTRSYQSPCQCTPKELDLIHGCTHSPSTRRTGSRLIIASLAVYRCPSDCFGDCGRFTELAACWAGIAWFVDFFAFLREAYYCVSKATHWRADEWLRLNLPRLSAQVFSAVAMLRCFCVVRAIDYDKGYLRLKVRSRREL